MIFFCAYILFQHQARWITNTPTWPAFLLDLLPQGYGRKELLKQLERDAHAGPAADWDLLYAGAGNPIGNVWVKEAHRWAMERTAGPGRGFTIDEVAERAGPQTSMNIWPSTGYSLPAPPVCKASGPRYS